MKFCRNCGTKMSDDVIVCPSCGTVDQLANDAPSKSRPVNQGGATCPKCGFSLHADARMCPACGFDLCQQFTARPQTAKSHTRVRQAMRKKSNGTIKAIKIFMILACVSAGIYGLIGLLWCIPMTKKAIKKMEAGEKLSTNFKICTLLFVNVIAGVLMLCDEDL